MDAFLFFIILLLLGGGMLLFFQHDKHVKSHSRVTMDYNALLKDYQRVSSDSSRRVMETLVLKRSLAAAKSEVTRLQKEQSQTTKRTQDNKSLVKELSDKEMKVLLMLVHPDKHKGSAASNGMFIKINSLITKT